MLPSDDDNNNNSPSVSSSLSYTNLVCFPLNSEALLTLILLISSHNSSTTSLSLCSSSLVLTFT
ncbi:hypothetical protein Hanom_Chr09g00819311 [Helianthus anomalus]